MEEGAGYVTWGNLQMLRTLVLISWVEPVLESASSPGFHPYEC